MPLSRTDLQSLRSLAQKKHRHGQGRLLVEGSRLVGEALESTATVERLLGTDGFQQSEAWARLGQAAARHGLLPEMITATQAEQLSDTPHPQGIFAVVRWPFGADSLTIQPPLLILDGIADPGNLGNILRTADWFGVPTVWVSRESADVTNPKVVRGGMGAHFHLPNLWQGDLAAQAQQLETAGVTLIGATMDGGPLNEVKPPPTSWALVLGSEAKGLSPFWRERLDVAVTIPGHGQGESLNVAVAAGIALHYLLPGKG